MSSQKEEGSWPELVGRPWKEAEDKIRADFKQIAIQVVRDGDMVTMDYRTDRVRIFIDADGKVSGPPCIG